MGFLYNFGAVLFVVSFVWAMLNYIIGSGLFTFTGAIGCFISYFLMTWKEKGVNLNE